MRKIDLFMMSFVGKYLMQQLATQRHQGCKSETSDKILYMVKTIRITFIYLVLVLLETLLRDQVSIQTLGLCELWKWKEKTCFSFFLPVWSILVHLVSKGKSLLYNWKMGSIPSRGNENVK